MLVTDTESVIHDAFLSFPFADFILTPSCYKKNVKKQTRYDSYNELAYLGKKRFTPDPEIYDLLGLKRDQKYVVVRFTGRTAVHDMGCRGITLEMKRTAVRELAKHARVFISSEEQLPGELESCRIPCPPERIHHALYYADLLFGDSATMASEAACLGTPAVYIDDRGRGYTDEQERKYGLVFNFGASLEDQERAVRKGVEILTDAGSKERWRAGRERMLGDKIDLTDFLVEFVEKRKTENRGER
jgi:hypothetical protein